MHLAKQLLPTNPDSQVPPFKHGATVQVSQAEIKKDEMSTNPNAFVYYNVRVYQFGSII